MKAAFRRYFARARGKGKFLKMSNLFTGAAMALGVLAVTAPAAGAATFADFSPASSSSNIDLTGLALSANAPVVFNFLESPALAAFGDLRSAWTLSATETGAVAFGPIALGTFDGDFSLIYSGPTQTMGGITISTGANLLSGTFLGSVFTGYGSSGSLVDSTLAGGLVSYTSDFLTFDPSGDQGLSLAFTSITPPVHVVNGRLTDFTAVTSANFAADSSISVVGGPGVPEPATWAIMLVGLGGLGATLRMNRRAKRFAFGSVAAH